MKSKLERLLSKNSYHLTRGHDFVEIGGIKWATMNVGANSITDDGLYFQWGDTQGYRNSSRNGKRFECLDYKFNPNGDGFTFTKYNENDRKKVLDLEDDAVHVNWGGAWRMPTRKEFIALGNAVTSAWTSNYQGSGVKGLVLTDNTDSSKVLFFPAAGICCFGHLIHFGSLGYYQSNTRSTLDDALNFSMYFNCRSELLWSTFYSRWCGTPIRGVIA